MSIKNSKITLEELENNFKIHNGDLNFSEYDYLITDWSGIYIEFAFLKNTKSILINSSRKILNDYRVLVKYNFIESINKSFGLTYDYTILTFKMIYELFTGQANTNNISGPFSIAEFSGKSLSMGVVYFVYLMAKLSISLGVLNL